jgi:hypothetical protein
MQSAKSVNAAAAIVATILSPVAMAASPHLLSPSVNHVAGRIVVPHQDSATLSSGVKTWLQSQGISYVIPRVPHGFPPVKPLAASRAAATHTPVGPHPVIRELALISPLTVLHPLIAHNIYWAVVLSPGGRPRGMVYVTFVEVRTPRVVGSLLRSHRGS